MFFEFLKDLKRAEMAARMKHQTNIDVCAHGKEPYDEEKWELNKKTGEMELISFTRKRTQRNWTASAWWLERRDPENWGRDRSGNDLDNDPLPWTGDEDLDVDIGKLQAELEEMDKENPLDDKGDE